MELFVNVACLQLDCLPRQKESNLSKALTFAQQAVVKGGKPFGFAGAFYHLHCLFQP